MMFRRVRRGKLAGTATFAAIAEVLVCFWRGNCYLRTLKVGIIGAGLWGANHSRVFRTLPQTEVVAVCDISRERAEAMGLETGVARAYTRYEDLIADSEIE